LTTVRPSIQPTSSTPLQIPPAATPLPKDAIVTQLKQLKSQAGGRAGASSRDRECGRTPLSEKSVPQPPAVPTQVVNPFVQPNCSSVGQSVTKISSASCESSETVLEPDPVPQPLKSSALPAGSSSNVADQWKAASDIPLNIEDFSVEQLSRSLELLRLPKLAEAFRDQGVDGHLMLNIITEESLINDFQCSSFEAKKAILFAQQKWRPKF
jgi:hypothetical protein